GGAWKHPAHAGSPSGGWLCGRTGRGPADLEGRYCTGRIRGDASALARPGGGTSVALVDLRLVHRTGVLPPSHAPEHPLVCPPLGVELLRQPGAGISRGRIPLAAWPPPAPLHGAYRAPR